MLFWVWLAVVVFLIFFLGWIHLDEFLDEVFNVLLGEDDEG